MLDGCREYRAVTHLSLALALECRPQQEEWVKLLRLFRNCTSFRFGLVEHNLIGKDMQPMMPGCLTEPYHPEDEPRTRLHCNQREAALLADEFFTIIVSCMAKAECRIETLTLGQASLHDEVTWEDTFDLEQLDFSHTKNVYPYPHLPGN